MVRQTTKDSGIDEEEDVRDEELRSAANAAGIAEGYYGVDGHWHDAPRTTLAALLDALGSPPLDALRLPPMVVLRVGATHEWALPSANGAVLILESGERRTVSSRLPEDLPLGYHQLIGDDWKTDVAVCPNSCYLPTPLAEGKRGWGWAAQLYALRSARTWGIGDFGALAELIEALAERATETTGNEAPAFVLLSPVHAGNRPDEPSPYSPGTRLFRDPLYLSVLDLPEFGELRGEERAQMERLRTEGAALDQREEVSRPPSADLKGAALRLCFAAALRNEATTRRIDAALRDWRHLHAYAHYRSLQRAHGPDWRLWPEAVRDGGAPPDSLALDGGTDEVRFHAWVQLRLADQLAASSSLPIGLVTDLAIGAGPDGFDAWRFRDLLIPGARVGAPPDPFSRDGQDWGLPAFVPWRLRAAAYEPFLATVRAAFARAGGIRIDHVMGLFRLFVIPQGAPAHEGTYVRQPTEDLLGLLALESHRARALVIGEDLGTVEPETRRRLAEAHILSYRLVLFERTDNDAALKAPKDYPQLALAAATTHDLPTIPGLVSGDDVGQLLATGAIRPEDGPATAAQQAHVVTELMELVRRVNVLEGSQPSADGDADHVRQGVGRGVGSRPDPVTLTQALYAVLGSTPSLLVAATLEDALGITRRPNVPGTCVPSNWSHRLPLPSNELAAAPQVSTLAQILTRGRTFPRDSLTPE